jgi:CRP-like cAMP-binding protein
LVGRFEQTSNGHRQITAVHIPGDMADLQSVVVPKTSWALNALTKSTIARIPHDALVELVDRYPLLARAFWRDCAIDGSVAARWALSLGRRDARARVAHLICELRCRYGAIGRVQNDSFEWNMTQIQLADALGLTAVHVNRMLKFLRSANFLHIERRRLTILDWQGLLALGDFDPTYLHLERQPAATALMGAGRG